MTATQDSLRSSHREALIEHLFLGEVMKHLWRGDPPAELEILKPQVDDAGYDLALEAKGILRHIQLKSSSRDAKTATVNVSVKLAQKPSGCVLWVLFDPNTMALGPFRWLGAEPGLRLPSIANLKVAKHTKGNAQGVKLPRAGLRVVPRRRFETLQDVGAVVERLFGNDATAS